MTVPHLGEMVQRDVELWKVDEVQSPDMIWIGDVQQPLGFEMLEQPLVLVRRIALHVDPKPLNPLIMNRASLNEGAAAQS